MKLLLAVCQGLHDEQSLAQQLNWKPQMVSLITRGLIDPVLGCSSGLLTAKVTFFGSSTEAHVSEIRLTPLGQQVCEKKSPVVHCP